MPRSSLQRVLGVLLVGLALCAGLEARAEPTPARTFGLGVGSSLGYLAGRTPTLKQGKLEYGLLDVNLVLPVDKRVVIQAWVPLSWLLWESREDPLVDLALIARVHPLLHSGLFVGSGLDLAFFKTPSDSEFNWSVRVPLAVGYETGFAKQDSFGLTVALRPALGLLVDKNAINNSTTTYGFAWSLLVELDLIGYFRDTPRQPAAPSPPSS